MRFIAICICLLLMQGCAALNKMSADFEERWEDPNAILEEMSENAPPSIEQQQQAKQNFADSLTTGNCEKIQSAGRDVLRYDESYLDARIEIAECDLRNRNYRSAKEQFTAVYDSFGDLRALRGLALAQVFVDPPADATKRLSEYISKDEQEWRVWNAMGYVADLEKEWSVAEESYLTAASLAPNPGIPLNNLGMSLIQQERFGDGIARFTEALQSDPSLSIARLNLRIAHAMNGDYSSALAGASESDKAIVLNNAGVAAMARGDKKLAKEFFRDALDTNPVFYAVAYENLERARLMSDN